MYLSSIVSEDGSLLGFQSGRGCFGASRALKPPGVRSKTPRDGQRAESGPLGWGGRLSRGPSRPSGAALARNVVGLTAISDAMASKAVLDKAPGSTVRLSLQAFEERRALRLAARWLRAIFLEIEFVIITLLREKDVFHHLEARRTVKAAG
jgi:hypothetical protein